MSTTGRFPIRLEPSKRMIRSHWLARKRGSWPTSEGRTRVLRSTSAKEDWRCRAMLVFLLAALRCCLSSQDAKSCRRTPHRRLQTHCVVPAFSPRRSHQAETTLQIRASPPSASHDLPLLPPRLPLHHYLPSCRSPRLAPLPRASLRFRTVHH